MTSKKQAHQDPAQGKRSVADVEKVHQAELKAIVERREKAFGEKPDKDQVSNSLVGLALSGGGVRSGAVCLGLIDALRKEKALKLVDYLSTVSGGGYAGAHLSSGSLQDDAVTEQETRESVEESAAQNAEEPAANGAPPAAENERKRSWGVGRLPSRTLQLIHGGSYLHFTPRFFNRHLIGLVSMSAFLISFLLLVAAATALVFRCMDYTVCRTLIYALGFDDEVKLAFFPSFILFFSWLFAWILSCVIRVPNWAGRITQILLIMLILVTLVAISTLLGDGEITSRNKAGVSISKDTTAFSSAFGTLLISAVIASLLPYFSFKRLIRSGKSPKNAFEKYTFWVASRALVYGLPFVAVAFFAQENISGWNERRDDRLSWTEIKSWSPNNPMWRDLLQTQAETSEKSNSSSQIGVIWPKDNTKSSNERNKAEALFKHHFKLDYELRESKWDSDNLQTIMSERREALEVLPIIADNHSPQEKNEDVIIPTYHQAAVAQKSNEAEYNIVESLAQLVMLPLHRVVSGPEAYDQNPISKNATTRYEIRQTKTAIVHQINLRLEDRNFCRGMWQDPRIENAGSGPNRSPSKPEKTEPPPNSPELLAFLQVQKWHLPTDAGKDPSSSFKAWKAKLDGLYLDADALAKLKTPDGYPPGSSPTGEQLSKSSSEDLLEPGGLAKERYRLAVLGVNRRLLEAYYGSLIADKSTVFSTVVLRQDQWARLYWLLWTLGIFLGVGFVMDLNATSLHRFYRDQIGESWIEPFDKENRLTSLDTAAMGGPYHLINGTVQYFGKADKEGDRQFIREEGFLFSQKYCGSESIGYSRTNDYTKGRYQLDDAVAISGGAVTPLSSKNLLLRLLMALGNLRLGQWVETPGKCKQQSWMDDLNGFWPYSPFRALRDRMRPIQQRSRCFVTDGGNYENLGIEPLIKRGCRLIVAMDAGQDETYCFADLTRLMRRMEMFEGIELELVDDDLAGGEFEDLVPTRLRTMRKSQDAIESKPTIIEIADDKSKLAGALNDKWSKRHFVLLRIIYDRQDSEKDGYLVYMKPTLTGDEPFGLQQFAREHDLFPHDETANQFFEPERFQSYHSLGYHIASEVCQYFGDRLTRAIEKRDPSLLFEPVVEAEVVAPADEESDSDAKERVDVRRELEEIMKLPFTTDPKVEAKAFEKLAELGSRALFAMPQLLELCSLETTPEDLTVRIKNMIRFSNEPKRAAREFSAVIREPENTNLLLKAIELVTSLPWDQSHSELINAALNDIPKASLSADIQAVVVRAQKALAQTRSPIEHRQTQD